VGDFLASVLLFESAPEGQRPDAAGFKSRTMQALDAISAHPGAQGVDPDELESARFALVAWADEVVLRSSWAGRDQWAHDLLQLKLFNTNRAGDEFFERLEALRPEQNDAREIYFLCLAMGFEGQWAGNEAHRQTIMRRHFEMLRSAGRARDVASTHPLAPPAYEVEIDLVPGGAGRLRRILLGWSVVAVAFFAVAWSILTFMASQMSLPPGA
jgi:type VI secretion system protein ImpK